MERRKFIKTTALASAALAGDAMISDGRASETETSANSSNAATLPRRPYGKSDVRLSVIGFGGIVIGGAEQEHANRLVAESVERGVNYFDVAPTYQDAEIKLGPALEPYRKNVFLACKTLERTRKGAQAELKRSLERLRTDHLDLYQLHALTDVEKDVDAVFAKGGATEVFTEAKKAGQIRFLGFSAHSEEAALAAMDRYDFDSTLFPLNFACYLKKQFGPRVIEKAKSKNMALLALKAMARQKWPKDDPRREKYGKCWYQPLTERREAELGLRFTLSLPITAAIPPGDESLFRLALELAREIKPINAKESKELKTLAATLDPIFPMMQ